MRRGPSRKLPVTLGRILRVKQTVCSAFPVLFARPLATIFNIGFDAGFAAGTHRAIESISLNNTFMNLGSAKRLPRTANILPSTALKTIEVRPPC